VIVDIGRLTRDHFEAIRNDRDRSIWRWFDFFPVLHRASIVSLGEGDTSVAAAKKLRAAGLIRQQDLVVCNITGHGLKQPEAIHISEDELRPILPNLAALEEQLRIRQS
jgi:threonine synthase